MLTLRWLVGGGDVLAGACRVAMVPWLRVRVVAGRCSVPVGLAVWGEDGWLEVGREL